MSLGYTINAVVSADDLDDVRTLFAEYVHWLDLDLSFQNYEAELAALPGSYTPPSGALFLARSAASGQALGCIGLRQLTVTCCEMKRLYVLPQAQGMGVGKALIKAVIRQARDLRYHVMKLDSLPDRMCSAIALYRRLGFVPCEAYCETPLDDTVFLQLGLTQP